MNFTADEFARGKRILLHCFVVSLSTGCPQDDTRGDDEVETGTTGDIDGSGDESDDSDGFCESGPDNCTFAPDICVDPIAAPLGGMVPTFSAPLTPGFLVINPEEECPTAFAIADNEPLGNGLMHQGVPAPVFAQVFFPYGGRQ